MSGAKVPRPSAVQAVMVELQRRRARGLRKASRGMKVSSLLSILSN